MTNKGRFSFYFSGGTGKANGTSSKFLLFHLLPNEMGVCTERILYQSIKEGMVIKGDEPASEPGHEAADIFYTEHPLFKLFTLVEGFGVQRFFYSFYIKLDSYGKRITLWPLYKENRGPQFFFFTGHILQADTVKGLIGEESVSWQFYQKQIPLPVSLLKEIVSITTEGCSPSVVAADTRAINF